MTGVGELGLLRVCSTGDCYNIIPVYFFINIVQFATIKTHRRPYIYIYKCVFKRVFTTTALPGSPAPRGVIRHGTWPYRHRNRHTFSLTAQSVSLAPPGVYSIRCFTSARVVPACVQNKNYIIYFIRFSGAACRYNYTAVTSRGRARNRFFICLTLKNI